jgi:hypothetical protein
VPKFCWKNIICSLKPSLLFFPFERSKIAKITKVPKLTLHLLCITSDDFIIRSNIIHSHYKSTYQVFSFWRVDKWIELIFCINKKNNILILICSLIIITMNVLLMLLQCLDLLLICLKEYAQVDTIQHTNQVHTNGVW